ncbi:cAMP-dependent protein kinase catalytic subunit 2 [Drosophila hydei]|uniref:cAMP-dependent protein kinase catalytic subunit 2 n=1 Tax=Drosophila hydei TaxID=7224 RepID=A0A6J1M6A3_DROHY|nr:cAMP-dependent protein kinase catalytic subunit 2 [Drosophila hydei]XP_030080727.1 cAMP-dependent protein kinase catalytic subunit 2 [Drosophila hydei]
MDPQYFSPKVEYGVILEKLKDEFNKKFNRNTPSPSCGLDNFIIRATLGAGSFGKVQLVKERDGDNYYASKQLSKDQIVKTKQIAHVMSEKKVLNSMCFPFTVNLISSYKDNDSLYLILPLIMGGELFTYHRKVRKFSEKQARFYAAQVFLALEYLHFCSLLYRDLKPENIMLDKNGYLKVTDFGFAKKVETRTMTLCGTPEYLPPEIIQSKPYGTSVDWWAFGVLIYEFVAGQSPFAVHSRDVMVMYNKICEADYKMPSSFSAPLRNLVDHLLQVDLSKRFGNLIGGNKDIKNHEWFKEVEWIPLLNQTLQPPYTPTITSAEDISNFDKHPEGKPKQKAKTVKHEEAFIDF